MNNYFSISDFCITDEPLSLEIADKILENFIVPLNNVRGIINLPIIISKKSGYRPAWYEEQKGRSALSEHTFQGKGAADIVCADMLTLGRILADLSPFTRICYYPNNNFFHVDYAMKEQFLFISRDYWKDVEKDEFLNEINSSALT